MSIRFHCAGCGKEVAAPDTAAGKKGKCPFCGERNEVPAPVEDPEDLIPLADIDEDEEAKVRAQRHALYEQEKDLLEEMGGEPVVPLDQRDHVTSEELHHFVVNYCLDLADGKLTEARKSVVQLKKYGALGMKAVRDFITGSATEPAMDRIPRPVLQGFLKELKSRVMPD